MDYTVHGILQARILEWVAFPFSRGSSQPRDRTQFSCIVGGFFFFFFHPLSPEPFFPDGSDTTLWVDSLPTELSGNKPLHIEAIIILDFLLYGVKPNLI